MQFYPSALLYLEVDLGSLARGLSIKNKLLPYFQHGSIGSEKMYVIKAEENGILYNR